MPFAQVSRPFSDRKARDRRKKRRKSESLHNDGQARSIISACLSWISSLLSSLPWWGLTPPRASPRLIRCVVNASHLKRALGNPQMIELTADDFIAAFRAFDAAVQI